MATSEFVSQVKEVYDHADESKTGIGMAAGKVKVCTFHGKFGRCDRQAVSQ